MRQVAMTATSDNRLILLSAPAGFGKTTLLSDWLATYPWPTSWLSLDRGDNDPVRFWTYLIAALQKIQPGLGESALALLCTALASPMEPTSGYSKPAAAVSGIRLLSPCCCKPDPLIGTDPVDPRGYKHTRKRKGGSAHFSIGSRRGTVIPLNSKASQALNAYLQDRKASSSPHLFLNSRGKPLGGRGVEIILGKISGKLEFGEHRLIASGTPLECNM
jgi:hypothetical protein